MCVRLSSEISFGDPDMATREATGQRIRYAGAVSDPRIWSVFDRDGRLVLAIADEPGEFNFARVPEDDVDPVECDFATVQCYTAEVEPQMLNLLFRSEDLEDFLERLREGRFRVVDGRPRPSKFARL